MKTTIFTTALFIVLSLASCAQKTEYLVLVETNNMQYAYVNQAGDTIIPAGKYDMCFTDTITSLGLVYDKKLGFIGIDINEKVLFEVFQYDNGPDYLADGLFRIIKNQKIGYANANGKIVIEPQFDCAYPFENGKAKVSTNCKITKEGEHTRWESEEWFHIDKTGKKVDTE